MRALHSSVFEIFLPGVSYDWSVRRAREKVGAFPRDHRGACVVVSRSDRYRLLMAPVLIAAEDQKKVGELPPHEYWVCKLGNGEPYCRPLYGPGARAWLQWYLGQQDAECLFLGTYQNGVRLAMASDNVYATIREPHSDCYCPACNTGYSL